MTTSEPSAGNRHAKIASHHLERWAIVYVRQSHPQQVQRHRESAQVQANLQQRALDWGWPRERIRILDGDQGCSATTTVGRDDFAWLLSEIALGHVGLVLGFQINRFAREDEACCRLIKVCATFDTLLADQDGLYHPLDFNDRLVLTIKGLMGGIELHQVQQRMQAGRLNRARRGEWLGQAPPGYVIGPDRKLQFDPDEQVQTVVRLILDQFAILGSLSGVLRYLRQQQIELPYRVPAARTGDSCTGIDRIGRRCAVSCVVRPMRVSTPGADTPTIRGGRCRVTAVVVGSNGNRKTVRCSCRTITPRTSPGSNTRAIANVCDSSVRGDRCRARRGRRCRCWPGWWCAARVVAACKRTTRGPCATTASGTPSITAAPACQSLVGEPLEQLVAEQVLQVVTPASLELSLRATAECERERAALDKQWQLRLERARQDTARAHRQYDAVEPENRLVARTLERKWEESPAGPAGLGGGLRAVPADTTARFDGGRACRNRDVGPEPADGLAIAPDRGG